MATIQISPKIKVGLDDLLQGVAQLGKQDFDRLVQEINNLKQKRSATNLSESEKKLLKEIDQPWSVEKQKDFNFLAEKLEDGTMTKTENQQYLKLVDEKTDFSIKRLENLTKLSKLRGVPLRQLMVDLELNPTS